MLDRLGPLRERDFRRLFASETISSLGDAAAYVALAFAVLEIGGSGTSIGLVIAARQVAMMATTLAGGV